MQLYYKLIFLCERVPKQVDYMHGRIHHKPETADSVCLIEEEGKALVSLSQCSMAGAQQFVKDQEKHISMFCIYKSSPLPPCKTRSVW